MNDYEITEVSVSVHEKRNHPHEYGHYDCEVRLTAQINNQDTVKSIIETLRYEAREQVTGECGLWIARIEYERTREEERKKAGQKLREKRGEIERLQRELEYIDRAIAKHKAQESTFTDEEYPGDEEEVEF